MDSPNILVVAKGQVVAVVTFLTSFAKVSRKLFLPNQLLGFQLLQHHWSMAWSHSNYIMRVVHRYWISRRLLMTGLLLGFNYQVTGLYPQWLPLALSSTDFQSSTFIRSAAQKWLLIILVQTSSFVHVTCCPVRLNFLKYVPFSSNIPFAIWAQYSSTQFLV